MSRKPRARVEVREDAGRTVIEAHGEWTVDTVGEVDSELRRASSGVEPQSLVIDLSHLELIDTSGAYVLGRVFGESGLDYDASRFKGGDPGMRRLIGEIRERTRQGEPEAAQRWGFVPAAARIGAGLEAAWDEAIDTFAFFGKTLTTLAAITLQPVRFRVVSTVHIMEQAGVNALPIIATLSFFIGAVVAYMGANLLETFGASVFTVELVGVSVLREFGVLITAIILSGRSASAFTASIGSMKMQQEIDAMRVLGLDPFEILVMPRVVACVLMAPLLTFAAMIAGLFGGMLVTWTALDISPALFITRLHDTIDWSNFWVGMSKAPVFGLVIAIVGCRQGMLVKGDVESLGRRTTASVVQSIFLVIVLDALFAMMYLELDI